MEDINVSSDSGLRAIRDEAQAVREQERPAACDAEPIGAEVHRGMAGSLVSAFCCVALWMLASRLLAVAFACSVVAALVALWITVSVVLVIHGVVATLWNDRERAHARK